MSLSRREFLAALLATPHLSPEWLRVIADAKPEDLEVYVQSLEQAAHAGDRSAIRALFRLLPEADGAAAEYINIVLGETIQSHARVFLEELALVPPPFKFGGLVENFGPDFVDEFEKQAEEAQKRLLALEAVQDPHLAELRDKCMAALGRKSERSQVAAQRRHSSRPPSPCGLGRRLSAGVGPKWRYSNGR